MDILAVCKSVFCNVLAVRRANLKLNIDRQGVCWLPGCWAHSSSRPANTAPCAGAGGSKVAKTVAFSDQPLVWRCEDVKWCDAGWPVILLSKKDTFFKEVYFFGAFPILPDT